MAGSLAVCDWFPHLVGLGTLADKGSGSGTRVPGTAGKERGA